MSNTNTNKKQLEMPDKGVAIIKIIGDDVASFSCQQFRTAISAAKIKDDSLTYDILQNVLARGVAKTLLACFGKPTETIQLYTADFAMLLEKNLKRELAEHS